MIDELLLRRSFTKIPDCGSELLLAKIVTGRSLPRKQGSEAAGGKEKIWVNKGNGPMAPPPGLRPDGL